MRIAVAGGTGAVGAPVVEAARAAGHEPVVIARSTGVDLVTGAGLTAALEGAEAVIDVSSVTTTSAAESVAFFEQATSRLLRAGADAGVRHHVVLSIVGCDRVDLGYYLGKRRQEELVLAGPVPATVLRATQFHEFAEQVLRRTAFGPVVLAPRMRSRPIAAREVAAALVAAAEAEPVGRAPDLAGPQERDVPAMVRQVQRARGGHRLVLSVRPPGKLGAQLSGGGLLPTGPGPLGVETFDEWLARS
ncbi:NAD(P)H-binding protein [Actinokineospora sp. PR83]|uniref:SDR family oxidoreductase n=1 Tax=Actinokineospora sp. PR83 TaxID=2884908 RepID=UPI001F46D4FC|nr:NAD(P)H-binding protein [Actinokineospora sp. PR83]MCG8920734.1 NAD(P)H-binding protein [Actinokineospora sp. PR83]